MHSLVGGRMGKWEEADQRQAAEEWKRHRRSPSMHSPLDRDGRRDWRVERYKLTVPRTLINCLLPPSPTLDLFPPSFFVSVLLSRLFCILSTTTKQTMSDADKGIAAQEVGMDAGAQDDRDMERLGKVQEFKVRVVVRLMSKQRGS